MTGLKGSQSPEGLARSAEELEAFVYNVSHDLRSPVGSIIQLSQLLKMDYAEKLDVHGNELVDTIENCGKRMLSLIESLLTYAQTLGQAEAATPPVSAEAQLAIALKNLQSAIQENNAKITADKLPEVRIGATQLMQLFQNLIGNAINYHSAVAPLIHISATKDHEMWQFSIADNGKGIDPKFHDFIFQPFKRVDTESKGTGLGLALCRKITERAGGRIWVDSTPGKGSTFHFILPAA